MVDRLKRCRYKSWKVIGGPCGSNRAVLGQTNGGAESNMLFLKVQVAFPGSLILVVNHSTIFS